MKTPEERAAGLIEFLEFMCEKMLTAHQKSVTLCGNSVIAQSIVKQVIPRLAAQIREAEEASLRPRSGRGWTDAEAESSEVSDEPVSSEGRAVEQQVENGAK